MRFASQLLVIASGIAFQILFTCLIVWIWGDWQDFFSQPALAVACLVSLAMTVLALASGANLSRGKRSDTGDSWIFFLAAPLMIAIAFVPAYGDRREFWTIDGDATRYAGLALLVAGGVLRCGPMFVLGRRFSALVAIQQNHELVTTGFYRTIRHPSYLGQLLAMAGWVLVFRSGIGLLMVALLIPVCIPRMNAEESLLLSEFGDQYAAYRKRTSRLLPFIY